ncbi:tetratricopeptide repeat protein [Lentzea alba]|uniref:tetratricopeptide repeat protein n=1 Tax=Lentzea alba TaxID=2714351 RepID=UPI0039BFDB76
MTPHDPSGTFPSGSSSRRIGIDDVRRIEAVTARCRDTDYRRGGDAGRDDILTCLHASRPLTEAAMTEHVRTSLQVALADLHTLAGWTCFDVGDLTRARSHLDQALTLAREAGNDDLAANIHYRLGRIHLHHLQPSQALARFQLGEQLARRSATPRTVSLLLVNQAWAHARMGAEQPALTALDQAHETFAAIGPGPAPPWSAFFDATDFDSITGVVYTELAQHTDTSYTSFALPALTRAVNSFGDDMARSRAFCLIMLAINHLIEGDVEHGAKIGIQAVVTSSALTSTRTKDRMKPLANEAYRHRDTTRARDLADHITRFTQS